MVRPRHCFEYKTIEKAEKDLKGLKLIILEVMKPNEKARYLYDEKLGFEEYGCLLGGNLFRGEYVDVVLMCKRV